MGRQAQLKRERRRAAAQGFEVPKRTRERDVDLLGSIRMLNAHMTEALCQEVCEAAALSALESLRMKRLT